MIGHHFPQILHVALQRFDGVLELSVFVLQPFHLGRQFLLFLSLFLSASPSRFPIPTLLNLLSTLLRIGSVVRMIGSVVDGGTVVGVIGSVVVVESGSVVVVKSGSAVVVESGSVVGMAGRIVEEIVVGNVERFRVEVERQRAGSGRRTGGKDFRGKRRSGGGGGGGGGGKVGGEGSRRE